MSTLGNWEKHVAKWQRWAATKKMTVQFEYWGNSEIAGMMSRDAHRGRYWFWFDDEQFSLEWFADRLKVSIANAGDRYTPTLNVALPITRFFAAAGRTLVFEEELSSLTLDFTRAVRRSSLPIAMKLSPTETREFQTSLDLVQNRWLALVAKGSRPQHSEPLLAIPWQSFVQDLDEAVRRSEAVRAALENLLSDERNAVPNAASNQQISENRDVQNELYHLRRIDRALRAMGSFCRSDHATLANIPALLVSGEAGHGKTHLVCDVANDDMSRGLPRLLFHGSHFTAGEPWTQMISLLGLQCNKDMLLGALEAVAQANGCRVLIIVDALNEGPAREMWSKHLAGMLESVGRSPWLGFVITVRRSYEDLVLPAGLVPNKLTRIQHSGFREHEHEASKQFFNHFGIQPTIPPLLPEFSNPLFLKLLCQGVRAQGLTQIPSGISGITAMMDFFLRSINTRLALPSILDYDVRTDRVRAAVKLLAQSMARSGHRYLPREHAVQVVHDVLPSASYDRSLFHLLLVEGVLTEDRWPAGSGQMEVVHFTYERFADHLVAGFLLDAHLDSDDPERSFSSDKPLGTLCKDEESCWVNQGLIEALSIQLPERVGRELFEVAPHTRNYEAVRRAFLESFVWRDRQAFAPAVLDFINSQLLSRYHFHDFMRALLTVSPISGHPYNAHRLHDFLSQRGLPVRDAFWLPFLQEEWGSSGAVDRLVDWARSTEDLSAASDDVVLLMAIVLSWFLASANRFLRDRATKALVHLLQNRSAVLGKLLTTFGDVDDLYVIERLYAVVCGCVLRNIHAQGVSALIQDVYERLFARGTPPPHLLLRDYARLAIEYAAHCGVLPSVVDMARVRPPYQSKWPIGRVPARSTLEKWGRWRKDMPDDQWAQVAIYSSVMRDEMGDFSRYVIGDMEEWLSEPLHKPHKPTHREIERSFVASLNRRQHAAWKRYTTVRHNVDVLHRLDAVRRKEILKSSISDADLSRLSEPTKQEFLKSLGHDSKKQRVFQRHVLPYLDHPERFYRENSFDGDLARRWIVQRVIELGWTVQRFGWCDRQVGRAEGGSRSGSKAERVGKKYQWIAWYELLARLSDNFQIRTDEWSGWPNEYHGPWTVGVSRDIDPTSLVEKSGGSRRIGQYSWWLPVRYESWETPKDDLSWLKKDSDLPPMEPLLMVTNPADGSRWCVLEAFWSSDQPVNPGLERYETARRSFWYMIKSYLVRKRDAAATFSWARRQHFMGRWMPESRESTEMLFGEYFWSPAFRDHDIGYYHRPGWTRGSTDRLPAPVLVTTDEYMRESSGYDCSIDETVIIKLPCRIIANEMELAWCGRDGHFFDAQGELVGFDPSVGTDAPSAFLINYDRFVRYLDKKGYALLWTVLGEKQKLGGGFAGREEFIGRLEVSGAFTLKGGCAKGGFRSRFVSPTRK